MTVVSGCAHHAGHSAVGRYSRDSGRLLFVLVCDDCGAERGDVDSLVYRPHARPFLNHPAELIARELGMDRAAAARLRLAALLCDIGMSRLPEDELAKPGPLGPEEWEAVHRHPALGAAMLPGPAFADLRPWILAHHERPDGNGYPAGLAGDEISLEARVLAVAHAYEAMLEDRPYRAALTSAQALAELERGAGTQFDPDVVRAAQRVLRRVARPVRAAA